MGQAETTRARTGAGTVQAVERALDLLEYLAAAGGQAGLADIAHATALPYGTAHRLLRTLAARGYVRQTASREYALAAGMIRLGHAAGRTLGIWAAPLLEELVAVSGESASLAVMEGASVVYVAHVPSPSRLRTFAEVGKRVLPHCTGVGKVLLAWRSPLEVERIVGITGMPRRTDKTVTSLAGLHDELSGIRARGYALDSGEEEIGVQCVAVPVLSGEEVIAAVSISGPGERIGRLDLEHLATFMRERVRDFGRSSPIDDGRT